MVIKMILYYYYLNKDALLSTYFLGIRVLNKEFYDTNVFSLN